MAKLIYGINTSLDGFMEDEDGNFDWSEPDEEVHQFFNDLMRGIGTQLYGRRLYETMAVWETDPTIGTQSPVMQDFADVWKAADKVVYSTTLERVVTTRTRIERAFDGDAIRDMKATATRDLMIGGPELAAHAIRLGLVDEYVFVVTPVAVGRGKRALPADVQLNLELEEVRGFAIGSVLLRYRPARP